MPPSESEAQTLFAMMQMLQSACMCTAWVGSARAYADSCRLLCLEACTTMEALSACLEACQACLRHKIGLQCLHTVDAEFLTALQVAAMHGDISQQQRSKAI